jgi:hypothetical protein
MNPHLAGLRAARCGVPTHIRKEGSGDALVSLYGPLTALSCGSVVPPDCRGCCGGEDARPVPILL